MFSKATLRDLCLALALAIFGAGLLLWPREVINAGQDALELCGSVILPSLFPFFVLSSLIVGLGLAEYPGRLLQNVMWPLFRVRGSCVSALVLGLIGGYPVGAKTAVELYQNGLCSKTEAERLLGFCNNSGPAFLLGVVGAGVFGSAQVGLLLCLVHIISAVLVGIVFRFYRSGEGDTAVLSARHSAPKSRRASEVFALAVRSSLASVLNVCGFILLFGVILRLLTLSGVIGALAEGLAQLFSPLGLTRAWAERLLGGFVELSNGVAGLPAGNRSGGIPMAAFLLGWGGLSVHCQTMSLVQDSGLSMKPCLTGKLLHGLLSALLAALSLRLLPGAAQAALALATPLRTGSAPGGGQIFFLCTAAAALVFALFLRLSAAGGKNRGGNQGKGRL